VTKSPLDLTIDPGSTEPAYLQIARAISGEIRRGRLRPGDPLPSSRALAEQLGVARNTVLAAYRELQDQGQLDAAHGSGSRVAERLPPGTAEVPRTPRRAGFDLRRGPGSGAPGWSRDLLQVGTGNPDPRLLPSEALALAYRRALTVNNRATLTADDPQGHPRLREAIASLLAGPRAVPATAAQVLVTRGAQLALHLVAQALLRPGDAVAVEGLGAPSSWEAIARAGGRCLPVPVDGEGLQVDALEVLAERQPLRAVLVTPRRHYPTLAPLSAARRGALLALAARHRFAVLEADLDAEFQFDGAPARPLAADDRAGVVVHLGVLSAALSPGLRVGFIHAPAPVVAELRATRAAFDRHGDPVLERALAELLEEGELQRHLNKMHQAYRHRRDLLGNALRAQLGDAVTVAPPAGGLAHWVRIREDIDVEAWARRALQRGVAFQPGRRFSFGGQPVAGLRMGFSGSDDAELVEAARRLRMALED
jgi:GntR family transcriptional regulator/MocR family aminotransferase